MRHELLRLSGSDIVRRVSAGEISARELVVAWLDHIERLEGTIHAWAHLDREGALRQAEHLDAKVRDGAPLGLLCGVGVGVKDVFNTADMPTQMGSPIWVGFTPGNDARVVHYLRQADAIIPGKTVTAEFAVHAPGPTANPHNPEYMPGTSSSGSAAAVASYMVPVALGTQTAGSTIRPASYCGIYGFKPSFGLIPRTGMLKTTDSLDTVGLFTRTIEDLGLLFDVVRVHGRDYPLGEAALNDRSRQEKPVGRPWRVALVRGPKWTEAEPYAQDALLAFAERLSREPEFHVDDLSLPEAFDRAHEIHATIYDRALAYYFKNEFQAHTLISGIMYEIISHGNRITLEEYKSAQTGQSELARRLDSILAEGFDIFLTLATGGEALRGLDSVDRPDNCLLWTLCGVPALSFPVFRGPHGLPFGAQVVARRYNDYLLLRFARCLRDRGLIEDAPCPVPALATVH